VPATAPATHMAQDKFGRDSMRTGLVAYRFERVCWNSPD
jgi:hypothetical protein